METLARSLNPFFYRSSVGQLLSAKDETINRLNPFFYRSSVGRVNTQIECSVLS